MAIDSPSENCSDCVFTPSGPITDFPGASKNFYKIFKAFTGGLGHPQSEDCLTLNIWTKGTGDRKKPVLVFFYGGSKAICTS